MPTEKPRFTITMDENLFEQIENFKYNGRYKNQTKAVTALIEKGLEVLSSRDPEVAEAIKNSPSAADATPEVNKKNAPLYSSEAERLAQDYDSLDDHGKRIVRLVVDEEKSRCSEQAQATSTTKLYIAARDGSRMEVEMDGDITLPDEDSQLQQ